MTQKKLLKRKGWKKILLKYLHYLLSLSFHRIKTWKRKGAVYTANESKHIRLHLRNNGVCKIPVTERTREQKSVLVKF